MINFIVCDDNEFIRSEIEKLIAKITMSYDFDYNVYTFSKYNKELNKIIKEDAELKIYILDIEMPGKTGPEIARKIRETDLNSIIMILTTHKELELSVLKKKLLIYDFISKFDDYEKDLTVSIKSILDKLNNIKTLNFKSNKDVYQIKFNNILYIYKDNNTQMSVIVTKNKEFPVRQTLLELSEKTGNSFIKTHRACLVNTNNIVKVDFNDSIIYFENNIKTDLLSRNYKKELKERLKK